MSDARILPTKVAEVLGGEDVLGYDVENLADLEMAVAEGLPVRALNEMAGYVTTSRQRARLLKDRLVPRATRARRRRLKPVESERVERLARLMALAEQVWDDVDDARAFLNTPHPLLEGRAPLDVALTELGARRVERILLNLEYGLPV
jgi:putative toxin-antitoxin system antitoxin component (TIGR02293 family)